jgi:hypothetical protein
MKFRKKFKPKTVKASPRSRRAIMMATFMTASLPNIAAEKEELRNRSPRIS